MRAHRSLEKELKEAFDSLGMNSKEAPGSKQHLVLPRALAYVGWLEICGKTQGLRNE